MYLLCKVHLKPGGFLVFSAEIKISLYLAQSADFSGLEKHLEDAQKRKEREQTEYVQKMVSQLCLTSTKPYLPCINIREWEEGRV